MQPFTVLDAVAAPMDRANVDTDAIIPKQYLKSVQRTGFGVNLFDSWRYLDPGEPGMDHSGRRPNPDFVLNAPRYKNAQILVARKNFGCGSSREHAVWALAGAGFRTVIAPSFGDIFFNNSFKNGFLPIVLPEDVVADVIHSILGQPEYRLRVDLEAQTVTTPDGTQHSFDIDSSRKFRLLNGLDDISLTLQHTHEIRSYEARRKQQAPWLFSSS